MEPLAIETATVIHTGFVSYHTQFKSLTRRAQAYFEAGNWRGNQANAVRRLDLYGELVGRLVTDVHRLLEDRVLDRRLWVAVKQRYAGLITGRPDLELAETFFNSITRRIFTTVGVNAEIEFIHSAVMPPAPSGSRQPDICRRYERGTYGSLIELLQVTLMHAGLDLPFIALEEDAAQIAGRIQSEVTGRVYRLDIVDALFFRGKGAYLIGRLFSGEPPVITPLVIALRLEPPGVAVDAVLLSENEMSVVFSFAHTYFHVHCDHPAALIAFLKSMLPRKPVSDLWISLGYNRHGKTVLYRELLHHLAHSQDQFVVAEGTPGMVMLVFTLPSYEMVFKVIKDQFDYPKESTRKDVMARYRLVFRHDRAGRLLDAQSFEYLEFDRDRFHPDLLTTLTAEAAESVRVREDTVVISFLYTERRVTPLNLYLGRVDEARQQAAVHEYGLAIRDLAATNIFPGDLFLKNFGVTRHGRVLFYDYDELCFLTECRFREIPPAPSWEEELSDQPWYAVAPGDVFPEQFVYFLGLRPPLKKLMLTTFPELFNPAFWRAMQASHRAGHLPDIFPYRPARRLAKHASDSVQ